MANGLRPHCVRDFGLRGTNGGSGRRWDHGGAGIRDGSRAADHDRDYDDENQPGADRRLGHRRPHLCRLATQLRRSAPSGAARWTLPHLQPKRFTLARLGLRRRSAIDTGEPRRGCHSFRSTEDGDFAARRGVVRMPRLVGSYLLTPVPEGGTHVVYTVDSDPGGSLPPWLVRQAGKDLPYWTLKNLKERAEAAPPPSE